MNLQVYSSTFSPYLSSTSYCRPLKCLSQYCTLVNPLLQGESSTYSYRHNMYRICIYTKDGMVRSSPWNNMYIRFCICSYGNLFGSRGTWTITTNRKLSAAIKRIRLEILQETKSKTYWFITKGFLSITVLTTILNVGMDNKAEDPNPSYIEYQTCINKNMPQS